MIDLFTSYIKKHQLFTKKEKLLVAVSGGADSMALCYLLLQSGHSFSVAHCHFNLRGAEADADAQFVQDFCQKKKIGHFQTTFDTIAYAEKKGISIQMAARELRYNWFDTLLQAHDFNRLLTAHQANDNIETFFINLLRGSGMNGLKAIVPKSGKLIRPLLFATRQEIEAYMLENNYPYRNDSSNQSTYYLRNNLRLALIPALKKLNPSLERTISREIEILQAGNLIIQKEVEIQQKRLLEKEGSLYKISIPKLKQTLSSNLILFELLKPFGFNGNQVSDVDESLPAQSGKTFYSKTHMLIKDRDYLYLKPLREESLTSFPISSHLSELQAPIPLTITYRKGNIHLINPAEFSSKTVFLDADTLGFPLVLNHWKRGDKFRPLGMKGFKKLSDYFSASKLNLFEKEKIWILRSSNEDIIWLVGLRMDDRFKVTEQTKNICIIAC